MDPQLLLQPAHRIHAQQFSIREQAFEQFEEFRDHLAVWHGAEPIGIALQQRLEQLCISASVGSRRDRCSSHRDRLRRCRGLLPRASARKSIYWLRSMAIQAAYFAENGEIVINRGTPWRGR